MTLKPCYVRVKSDIKNVEGNFVYGMVSNTKSVGGMKFLVGGSTDLQDGLFEVTLIREIKNPMDLQQLVNAFMTQKFVRQILYVHLKLIMLNLNLQMK